MKTGRAGGFKGAQEFLVLVVDVELDLAFWLGGIFLGRVGVGRLRFLVVLGRLLGLFLFGRNGVFQVVGEQCAVGRIFGGKHLLAGAPTARAKIPKSSGTRGEESEVCIGDAG